MLKHAGIVRIWSSRQERISKSGRAVSRRETDAWEGANGAMKRVVKAIIGSVILAALFATLLALELCFIAGVVAGAAGIIVLVRMPIPPVEVDMSIWRAVETVPFGLIALVCAAGAVMLPYFSVIGWRSTRQSAESAASAL